MRLWKFVWGFLKKSMHVVTDKLEARSIEAEKIQSKAATSQSKLQSVTIALTVVIARSTVAYTWITWQSVQAQREANQIQREARAAETKSTVQATSNASVEAKSGAPDTQALDAT